MVTTRKVRKWHMVVDVDRCTGCQACVIACQAENNVPINAESQFNQRRAFEWIRVERYWAPIDPSKPAEFPNVKARFLPVLCQHCDNAPCEPVCPVFATYHNNEGLNVQVYNRCVGTRYCQNNCPYHVRFFNFWEPIWPEPLRNQLNPDVTVRSRGVMEKCTFNVQRIRRAELDADREGRELRDGEIQPACVQACPTNTLIFGDINDPNSKVRQYAEVDESTGTRKLEHPRAYRLLESLGTEPNVTYLKKVDPELMEDGQHA